MKFDSRQRRLLFELSKDSRMQKKALAKKLRLSQPLLNYTLSKMSKNRLFEEEIIVDPARFDLTNIRVLFSFTTEEYKTREKIIRTLEKDDTVVYMEKILLGADLLVEYSVPNLSFYNKQMMDFMDEFGSSIRTTDIFPIIVKYILQRKYLYKPDTSDMVISGDRAPVLLSQRAAKVLAALVKEPTAPIVRLAEKTKSSSRSVINIIKNLEQQGVIKGYTINLNFEELDIETCTLAVALPQQDHQTIKSLINYVRETPEITQLVKTINARGVLIRIETLSHYSKVIKQVCRMFNIYDYRIYEGGNVIKNTYVPLSQIMQDFIKIDQ
ncbi:Lrp/AsnC family transcriptional regulator [Candidatus Woesearchaeota archaeon]|nr:Lrp/AsnC family transcriptional regulator [Candidatus Woesearchaeota archaeon]